MVHYVYDRCSVAIRDNRRGFLDGVEVVGLDDPEVMIVVIDLVRFLEGNT